METSIGKPYQQKQISEDIFERVFDEYINEEELVWHRDKKDRLVKVLNCGDGWKFQYENSLPFNLIDGMEFNIQKETFHRIIKGEGNLLINIKELS